MYLTIQLVLFACAFVLFTWQLCTWRPCAAKRRPDGRRRFSSLYAACTPTDVTLEDFDQPGDRLGRGEGISAPGLSFRLGDEYRPVNRIRHYFS